MVCESSFWSVDETDPIWDIVFGFTLC